MDIEELADETLPSGAFAAITYDPETGEVGIQYDCVLVSLPREDFERFAALLDAAGERLLDVLTGPEGEGSPS